MNKKWLVVGLFLVVFILRVTLSYTVPNLTPDSYFHLRQVEEIRTNGVPLYNDPLSYGGRQLFFLPLFHYLVAGLSFLVPLSLIVKLLPNLLFASLTLIVYLISYQLTKNETSSLISAIVVGIMPIFYQTNSFTPLSLFLPSFFLTIYFYLNTKKNIFPYLISFLILSLITPAALLLLLAYIIYLILSWLENRNYHNIELELITFSIFFFIWLQFLFYKNYLINEGTAFIWQNVPTQLLSNYFASLDMFQVLMLIGIIPVIAGAYAFYRSLFELKQRTLFLLISLVISLLILLLLNLIRFDLGISVLGIILAIFFAQFYQDIFEYMDKLKVKQFNFYLPLITIVLLVLTVFPYSLFVVYGQDTPTNEKIIAYQWLAENTKKNEGVLALLEEGHLVTYYGQRKNMIDENYLGIKDVETRYYDLRLMQETKFQTRLINLMDKYDLRYFVYHSEDLPSFDQNILGNECFKLIYRNETLIYERECELR